MLRHIQMCINGRTASKLCTRAGFCSLFHRELHFLCQAPHPIQCFEPSGIKIRTSSAVENTHTTCGIHMFLAQAPGLHPVISKLKMVLTGAFSKKRPHPNYYTSKKCLIANFLKTESFNVFFSRCLFVCKLEKFCHFEFSNLTLH